LLELNRIGKDGVMGLKDIYYMLFLLELNRIRTYGKDKVKDIYNFIGGAYMSRELWDSFLYSFSLSCLIGTWITKPV